MKKERVLQFVAVAVNSISDKALLKRTLIDFLKAEIPEDISVEQFASRLQRHRENPPDVHIDTVQGWPFSWGGSVKLHLPDTLIKAMTDLHAPTLVNDKKLHAQKNLEHWIACQATGRAPQMAFVDQLINQLDLVADVSGYINLYRNTVIHKDYLRKQLIAYRVKQQAAKQPDIHQQAATDMHGHKVNPDLTRHETSNGAAGNTQAAGTQPGPKFIPFFEAWKLLTMGNSISRFSWPNGQRYTMVGGKVHFVSNDLPTGTRANGLATENMEASDWFIVK